MSYLADRFNQPLPSWIEDINGEAYRKIIGSRFAAACRRGETRVMQEIFIRHWPFVHEFPEMVNRGCIQALRQELAHKFGVGKLNDLVRLCSQVLKRVQKDEESHRALWQRAAEEVRLQYADLNQPPIPEVTAFISAVDDDTDLVAMFFHFVAVEILAESVSTDFLASEPFTAHFSQQGLQWFRVHTNHEGLSHEELFWRLAFTFQKDALTQEEANDAVQHVINLFVDASEACVQLAYPA